MRAIVTGAGGYIGSHLCWMLKARGWTVCGIDRRDVNHIWADEWITGNINFHGIYTGIYGGKVDVVFHLAAYISVEEGERLPLAYFENNVGGTTAALRGMKMMAPDECPIIFSSTAAVYGEKNRKLRETDDLEPSSVYGKSKLMAEQIVGYENRPSACLRYFNVAGCGPGLVDNHEAVTHLIPKILKSLDHEVLVYGQDYNTPDGTCLRDYVHVLDICEAHIKTAELLLEKPQKVTMNLGSGVGHSVLDVINTATRVYPQIRYSITDRRPGDSAELVADIDLAKDLIGWSPKHSLEEIISSHRF